jgi:hypothetical protein
MGVLVSLLLFPAALAAQEEHELDSEESAVHETGHHKNHLALALSVIFEEDETGPGLGLDYERRFSRRFGIGALAHYAFGDLRAWVVAAPIFLHATDRLTFQLGAGYEKASGHDGEALIRLGVEYAFHVGRFTIAPAFNVDIIEDDEILLLGVNIGRGF